MTSSPAADLDIERLRGWIGRTESATDVITERLANELLTTLGAPLVAAGAPAPPGIHWCLAPALAPPDEVGPDGHPARGGFLPPVPLPRRMWAGGAITFAAPLHVGDAVTRESRIADVAVKEGRSGRLCFVTVEHAFSTSRGVAVRDRQDIVYRAPTPAGAGSNSAGDPPAAPPPGWRRSIDATTLLLFRYSALTFNGHRIHYDRDYAMEVEGYAGLVVHGPLQATLLLHHATRLQEGGCPRQFSYRGLRPLIDGGAFTLNAVEKEGGLSLWAADQSGAPTMSATASW